MVAAHPHAGARYRYSGEHPIGVDAGALLPGTVVEIRNVGTEEKPASVVKADEPGAGDNAGDCVVVEWDVPGIVMNDDLEYVSGVNRRAMAFPLVEHEVASSKASRTVVPAFHDLFTKEA